jgi:DNA polymerase
MDLDTAYRGIQKETALSHLRAGGIKLVPGRGAIPADAFVVGEAPGATENTTGRPFTGASGRVLSQLMESAGLSADETSGNSWITNTLKYRPPGNRTPTENEIMASLPFLRMEWAAVGRPLLMIAVGAVAYAALGGSLRSKHGSLTKAAGQPIGLPTLGITLWPMVHPAYGLRNFAYRSTMERHWEALGDWRERNGYL